MHETFLAPNVPKCSSLEAIDNNRATSTYYSTGRIRPLLETIDIAWNHRAQVGISRVADITALDVVGLPVFNVYRPAAEPTNLTVSCGKGMTHEDALASALMEGIERHYGEQRGRQFPAFSLEEISHKAERFLHPRSLNPDLRTAIDSSRKIEWVPARTFTSETEILVPAEAVFTPYAASGSRMFSGHSDGLVAGNSLEEAVLHGMHELIERDAQSFGELLGKGFRVDLATLPEEIRTTIERFTSNGIEVHLVCFESPVRLPVIFAVGIDLDARSAMLIAGGAGCALEPMRAAYRALTELAQSRLSIISGAREDFALRHRSRQALHFEIALAKTNSWLDKWPVRGFEAAPNRSPDGSISGDLDRTLAALDDAALEEVIVIPLTDADLPVQVAKVIIPGIEFAAEERFRVGPRLYEAAKGVKA